MFAAKIAIFAFSFAVAAQAAPAPATPAKPAAAKENVKKVEAFKPFTGKVLANKVRIRVKPDLDSHIFRQSREKRSFPHRRRRRRFLRRAASERHESLRFPQLHLRQRR